MLESKFWPPTTVLGDVALGYDEFKQFLTTLDIEFQKIPPSRQNKNKLESKHGVIRSVFLRLLNEKEDNAELAAMQAV